MNEALSFSKLSQQEEFVAEVLQWAQKAKNYDKIATQLKSVAPAPTPPMTANQSTNNTSNQLLSDLTQREKSFYSSGVRTWHMGIEPSTERLEGFKHRNIIPNSTFYSVKKRELPIKKTFPYFYPKNEFVIQQEQTNEERQLLDSILQGQDEIKREETQKANEEESGDEDEEVKKPKQSVSLAPAQKQFTLDDQMAKPRSVQRQFETSSNHLEFVPPQKTNQLELEKQWFKNRNYEVRQKKQDEEMIEHIVEWGKTKSRIDKEIFRRIDSRTKGSQFEFLNRPKELKKINEQTKEVQEILDFKSQQIKEEDAGVLDEQSISLEKILESLDQKNTPFYQMKPINRGRALSQTQRPKFLDYSQQSSFSKTSYRDQSYEKQISSTRVQNVIQGHKNILNLTDIFQSDVDVQDDSYRPKQLSVYGCSNLNSDTKYNKFIPFSVMLQQKQQSIQDQQINEVRDVKERLAKNRVMIPIKKLVNSLVTPQPVNSFFSQTANNFNLPEPGYGLSVNPFEVEKEKKKNKKNKKKH